MNEIKFIPDNKNKTLKLNGKIYRMSEEVEKKDGHLKEIIFTEFDEEKYEEDIDDITEYLINSSKLTTQDIIRDILKGISLKELAKIKKQVIKKDKVKIKKGCLNLTIGKTEISILE